MTLEQYQQKTAALDSAHVAALNRVRNIAKTAAVERVRTDLRFVISRIPNMMQEAVGDVADVLVSQIGMDENYNPVVVDQEGHPRSDPSDPTRPYGIEQFARDWLQARPHFLRAGGGSQAGGSAPVTWSIEKAAADLEYDQKWQKADMEGNKKAWREHLAAMSRPVYR